MAFDAAKRPFILINENSKLGDFKNQDDEIVTRYGGIIRTGDIIKFGSTLLLIKESSIDN